MKTFQISSFRCGLTDMLNIAVALTGAAVLSSCASNSWLKQEGSSLFIETTHSGSGSIMSFRAYETADRLYVVGSAKTHPLKTLTHVDVQLIDSADRVLAEKTDDLDVPLHPRISRGRNDRQSYVVSFSANEARQAVKIRVICHGNLHSNL